MESSKKRFESGKIKKLERTIELPASLEYKILFKLRSLNLLAGNEKKYVNAAFKTSYAIVLLLAGIAIGSFFNNGSDAMPESTNKSKYILLLYKNESLTGTEPERVKNYAAWAREYGAQQKVIGGEKLENTGIILSSSEEVEKFEGEAIYENPRTASGFFIIQAGSYEDAIVIAQTCPHIKYGGKIELREIADLSKANI